MEQVPPLWHFRCDRPKTGDFVKWQYARSVEILAYRNGAWPVTKNDVVEPAHLGSSCITEHGKNLTLIKCPLCFDVSVVDQGSLVPNQHYVCPGHGGSAMCPGYVFGTAPSSTFLSSGAKCCIQ